MQQKMIVMLLTALFICLQAQAQDGKTYYLILTSVPLPAGGDIDEGIVRSTPNVDASDAHFYNTPPTMFTLVSKSRGIWVPFLHADYNLTELAKIRTVNWDDKMEVLEDPYFDKYTIRQPCNCEAIKLNVEFPKMTKQQAEDLGKRLVNQKVYVVDSRDAEPGHKRKLLRVKSIIPTLEY